MFRERSVEGEYQVVAAHAIYGIIAAANINDGSISILSEDHASTILNTAAQNREASVAQLLWHPSKRILAVGWSNGLVGVWSDSEEILREGNSHRISISCLEWNSTGSRLISCDEEGEAIVWKVDLRGKISLICQYRLKGSISRCIFRKSLAPRNAVVDVNSTNKASAESSAFYLVCNTLGKIFYADDMGRCSEAGVTNTKILSTKLVDASNEIALITDDLVFAHYSISQDGKMILENEMKISTPGFNDPQKLKIAWIDDGGIIAITSGTSKIRILDIANEESMMLSCGRDDASINSINWCPAKNIFCAVSTSGSIFFWKHQVPSVQISKKTEADSLAYRWTMLDGLEISEIPQSIIFGGSGTSVIVPTKNAIKIFEEEKACCATYQGYSILQISPSVLRIFKGGAILEIDIQDKIERVAISCSIFVVSTGSSLQVFDFPEDLSSARLQSSINSESSLICVDSSIVFAANQQKIDIFNATGALKGSVSVGNRDGIIKFLAVSNNIMAIGTSKDILKLYDLSRREPRFITSKSSQDSVPALKLIQSIALNKNGTLVAYTGIAESDDCFFSFDMKTYNTNPLNICWGSMDQRILVFTFFVSYHHGMLYHDRYLKFEDTGALIGVSMPFHYFLSSPNSANTSIVIKAAPDFLGVENADSATISSIIEFCYQIDIDNVDAAFRALNKIDNDRVWTNLAKICVKTRRVDVASTCLSNIRHAKAVSAYRRRSENEISLDLKSAILAIFLDMPEEVQEIYEKAERFDLLNLFYQESGRWEQALEVAASRDRINLKTTYVKFGRYLMDIGDRSGAIAAFEKASALTSQVPQQIFVSETELKSYAIDTKDKSLKKWWAQYEETRGNLNDALKFYDESGDLLSIVRLHCSNGRIGKAIEIANKSENPAAAYHIARYYERENKISEAIEFYGQAKCHTQAIRLAKENNLINPLINLALQGNKESMLDVANYLEKTGSNIDKAITLYHRAGQTSKAIDLCFVTKEFHVLDELAQSLGPNTDSNLLHKCARFFMDNDKFEEAVALLTTAKQYRDALSLCVAKNITLTEELVDKLAGGSTENQDDVNPEFLIRIAELCLQQKSYHLACKKFSQAGDNVNAIKSLMRSGDVERIIFFAGVSGPKQKEIYVIAANYLQTLDWRSNATIMKAIIQFYTKARAFDSLASFYDSCSQVEIDEYQNYEKALGALKESAKMFSKAKETEKSNEMARSLMARIAYLEAFVAVRASNDPAEIVGICGQLLKENGIDRAVRIGDIYALMIETHYSHGNMAKASELLQEMQMRISMNLDYYLDASILRSLRNLEINAGGHGEDEIEEDY
ncbi:hypothetical protein HK100_010068 [Physocladia obscura]|uniref:Uncharacterized protein n=1 Tax=Physocladia obscura TaxID=109957 RepID=A0AAD5XKV9_9FUNG|nr:hypothetical protein HK100_010068 [Physocladia obscura]